MKPDKPLQGKPEMSEATVSHQSIKHFDPKSSFPSAYLSKLPDIKGNFLVLELSSAELSL